MKTLRRTMGVALFAVLLVAVAGPLAAARCRMSGYCPMMAKAAGAAPCSERGGSMAAPMDCCRPKAATPPTSLLSGLEPLLASLPAATAEAVARTAVRTESAYSRAGSLHPLGLFTLHSVWRI